jgi:hypothetical protein
MRMIRISKPDHPAANKRHQRQRQRPLQADEQVAQDVPEGEIAHARLLLM